ncbi:hypothetical protein JHW43_003977 [Diplocarpon mali]|nr:hypothetical protein JHW43_003977 [Diplocarpon mali]
MCFSTEDASVIPQCSGARLPSPESGPQREPIGNRNCISASGASGPRIAAGVAPVLIGPRARDVLPVQIPLRPQGAREGVDLGSDSFAQGSAVRLHVSGTEHSRIQGQKDNLGAVEMGRLSGGRVPVEAGLSRLVVGPRGPLDVRALVSCQLPTLTLVEDDAG